MSEQQESEIPPSPPIMEELSAPQELRKLIDAQVDPESKLAVTMMLLEKTLAHPTSPQFRTFWELRKICQGLFRENLSPGIRANLWARLTELTDQARRLKDHFDEQSAFAAEQIGMAIRALEDELGLLPQRLEKLELPEFPAKCRALKAHYDLFRHLQRELNLLNISATRIHALRKELVKTEMRIGQKSKLFHRLSAAGDGVFPRRKQLIQEVSQQFLDDVSCFLNSLDGMIRRPEDLRHLREEIKDLQAAAKILTLNSKSFIQSRKQLSNCWDKIKEAEKEQRNAKAKEREISKEQAQQIETRIQEFKEQFERDNVAVDVANQQLDDLSAGLKGLNLDRQELAKLKVSLRQARQIVIDKSQATEKLHRKQQADRARQRREQIEQICHRIQMLNEDRQGHVSKQLAMELSVIEQEMVQLRLSHEERALCQHEIKRVRDLIIERREQELLALPADQQQALHQLQELWHERYTRRQEIRDRLEALRKTAGTSGRDFQQALALNAQITEERARLEQVEEGIRDIEERLVTLEDELG